VRKLGAIGLCADGIALISPSSRRFFGVHDGLAMGSIYIYGSGNKAEMFSTDGRVGEESLSASPNRSRGFGRLRWPHYYSEARWRQLSPHVEKRWIGNAPCVRPVSVMLGALTLADNQVKGFIVGYNHPWLQRREIQNKIAIRSSRITATSR